MKGNYINCSKGKKAMENIKEILTNCGAT